MKLSEKVYELVTKMPKGKVTTYGEIARVAGKPNTSQAVGQILKKTPIS